MAVKQQSNNAVIANIDHVKQVNYAAIYKVIEENAPVSRVDIAKLSKLAPASVTKITRQLLASGLITEIERQASTGGRRAISLALNTASVHVLAIKIGRKLLSIARYNLAGELLSQQQTEIDSTDGQALIEQLLKQLSETVAAATQKISAIAITYAGLINPKQGVIISSSSYTLKDFPIVACIEEKFAIPTFVGNHTRCLALAEHYFGASQDCLDSILISIHHGVGSGIIVQGQWLLGENCNIGEIGHIQANPAGKQCYCGNFGCLETEVSDDAILEKVTSALQRGAFSTVTLATLSIENIYQAAAEGDPLCQKIVADTARYLGRAVAILVNILNPEKIVISGKITASDEVLFSTLQQSLNQQTLREFRNKLSVVATELAENTTIGAFALIKQAIYEGDLLQKLTANG